VRDEPAEMRARLKQHLDTHDVLILSGGVSMGRFDLVPSLLTELGVRMVFHKVAQRPGKTPVVWGRAVRPAVFALPGNPVSTLVCLSRYVIPALLAAMVKTPRRPQDPAGAPVSVASKFMQLCRCAPKSMIGAGMGAARVTNAQAISPPWPAPTALSSFRLGRIPTRRAS